MKTAEMTSLRVAEDITELVGETPILHLRKIVPPNVADVYAKLEYLNPGGSIKDRAALGMILKAEQAGLLQTGQSVKYDSEKITGRWDFNIAATTSRLLETRPVISSREMRTLRAWVTQSYAKTAFVAGADGQAFLKNLAHLKTQPGQPPTTETAAWQGKWKGDAANYELSLSSGGQKQSMPAHIDGTPLTIKDDKTTLVFDHE